MSQKQFTHLIYIGRFQPFHNGHLHVLKAAAKIADNIMIVCGSANRPRTPKNPLTFEERSNLIRRIVLNENIDINISFFGASDSLYSDTQWATEIQNIVEMNINGFVNPRVGIIGCVKDESSYYLKMFPQWELIEVVHEVMNATDVRESWFEAVNKVGIADFSAASDLPKHIVESVPAATIGYINDYTRSANFVQTLEEYNRIKEYKENWKNAPYSPTFVTVDAVVVQSAHILLVRRKHSPGKGLWALPGGFLDQKERIQNAMVRELYEETKLKVPMPVIHGSIVNKEVYDHPDRSLRGRTITHAFHVQLPDGKLSPVKGSDDAEKAKWFPLSDVLKMDREMFEDHIDIIRDLLKINQ